MAEAAFRQYFYQMEHWNHFTEEPDIGPCLLSIKREGETDTYRYECSLCCWLLDSSRDHLETFPACYTAEGDLPGMLYS